MLLCGLNVNELVINNNGVDGKMRFFIVTFPLTLPSPLHLTLDLN